MSKTWVRCAQGCAPHEVTAPARGKLRRSLCTGCGRRIQVFGCASCGAVAEYTSTHQRLRMKVCDECNSA